MIEGYMGVDPGLRGAISIISNDNIEIFDFPVVPKPYGKGNMISPDQLSDILKIIVEKYDIKLACLESVSAMTGQGVTGVFSFGRSLGTIEGCIASRDIPINYVTPRKWKSYFELIGSEKDAARLLVLSKYPNYHKLFKRKKDCDRADSLLIGLYGKHNYGEMNETSSGSGG